MTSFRNPVPDRSIGLQFWRVGQLWQKQIAEVLRPFGLTHTNFVILATVKWHQGQSATPSQADIAKTTNIEKMALSKAIGKLESNDFVSRERGAVDSRVMLVSLTKKSEGILPSAIEVVEQVDSNFFGQLKKAEVESLLAFLNTLSY